MITNEVHNRCRNAAVELMHWPRSILPADALANIRIALQPYYLKRKSETVLTAPLELRR